MGQKLILGPFSKGLQKDVLPFAIDNNSFPTLLNAYQWRGRVKRKRGTQTLTRLRRYFNSNSVSYSATSTITLDGSGIGNILNNGSWTTQTNASIVPGTVTLVGAIGPTNYTDPTMDGYLTPTGTGGLNLINYASGQITIPGQANQTITAIFWYYPNLPAMGFRELNLNPNEVPGSLAFNTTYAYNVVQLFPYLTYSVSFYKNPPTSGSYTQKTDPTPLKWNGQNYQQFWTTNYAGAFWATNGITIPFLPTNIGMQFKPIVAVTVLTPTTANLEITGHGLVVGDFVFVNEVLTTTGINFQTGYVTTETDIDNVIVTFPNATIATNGTGGIAQYLTSSADATKDCLRWYDGDPTDGSTTSPALNTSKGWVNFCPPLSYLDYNIANLPQRQYYLVGGRILFPYKDRLVVLGPVVQASTGNPIYLQDTAIFSQDGTPYYTCSFTGDPTLANTEFNALLVPTNQTATANAWYEDVIGYGGFRSAAVNKPITTMEFNDDVPIIGFKGGLQTRLVYTSNDAQPFDFYLINSEFGSTSTFSVINTDQGVMTRGDRGIILTSQVRCDRIDLLVPNQVFDEMRDNDNGNERTCAIRDFSNEWIYFTYPADQSSWIFPTQTFFYNFRDQSWAVFDECYTCYGYFQKKSGLTWNTVGAVYPTWDDWNDPWDSYNMTIDKQLVVGGNQQGFIMVKGVGTAEQPSLFVQNISGTTVTSPNHCLETEDFITLQGLIGTSANTINGQIFQVKVIDANSFFILSDSGLTWTGTYYGGGTITRLYRPYIQTKMFPAFWDQGLKTRIGVQQYLFTKTTEGSVQVLIFLSQNPDNPYNEGPIYPAPNTVNSSLVYTTNVFTCPESINLGLTQFTKNLQMPTAIEQEQIWHRMSTSLIGDTVQIGITLSDDQMKDIDVVNEEIELHSVIIDLNPAGYLA